MTYKGKKIAVCVPAYNEELLIAKVVDTVPDYVDLIIIVDDKSSDNTGAIIANKYSNNERVIYKRNDINLGVGGSIEIGYKLALEHGSEVICVMSGDNQCRPEELIELCDKIISDGYDYVKVNRLYSIEYFGLIPKVRLYGNAILSFLTRLSTGYWHIGDSQAGFTAASDSTTRFLLGYGLYPRYGVPNDILGKLSFGAKRVVDVPSIPVYNVGEKSNLKPAKVVIPILKILTTTFIKRIFFYRLIVSPSPIPILYLIAFINFLAALVMLSFNLYSNLVGKVNIAELLTFYFLISTGLIFSSIGIVMDYFVSDSQKD